MQTLGIIGAGNMGQAFGIGLRSRSSETEISFFDIDRKKAEKAAERCGASSCSNYAELLAGSEAILLAVKPQHLAEVCSALGAGAEEKKYISIIAGTPIAYIEKQVGTSRIVRFMPNLAATVGESVVGISCGDSVDRTFREEALEIAASVGTPIELPEGLLAAVTGLSGSGIAYVFAFLHAMALGGTDAGLSYQQALQIAYSTTRGAVKLLESEGVSPSEYLTRVTSAGGTTIRGIKALEKGGFTHTVMEAVTEAASRAEEIEEYMQ